MAIWIPCPNCGPRPFTEFSCAGELPDHSPIPAGADPLEADFQRVWLRRNTAGPQRERWFHFAGCRRWLTLTRNTVTNQINDVA